MSEPSILMGALLAGMLLGAIFYGGLWWTVRRSISSKTLSAWFIGSFAIRAGIALSGFYFVSQGDWRSVLACLIGFLIARIGATVFTREPRPKNRCVERIAP